MTTLEKRARAACAELKQDNGGSFGVEWTRSRAWGLCARIMYRGEKAAHAGGCGYDKLSAVVAEYLYPLIPEVRGCGGAGIRTLIETAAKAGWDLRQVYSGKLEDAFTLSPLPQPQNVNPPAASSTAATS